MTNRTPRKWYRRRELYLVAGIVVGISIMIVPALVHTTMGPTSPFGAVVSPPDRFESQIIMTPVDLIAEFIWLTLPAIFLILAIYWIFGRRSRWAGYDEAVKWARR